MRYSNIFSPQIKMIIGQCVNDRCNPLTFILKYFPPSFDITITFLWTIYIYFDITITFYGLFTNIIYIIKILRRVAHPLDEWVWCALDEVKKTYKAILIEGYVIFLYNIFNIFGQCIYDRIPTFLEMFPSSFEYFFSLMKYSNIQYIQCHSHWTGWPRQEDSDLYWNIFLLLLRDIFFLFRKSTFFNARKTYQFPNYHSTFPNRDSIINWYSKYMLSELYHIIPSG